MIQVKKLPFLFQTIYLTSDYNNTVEILLELFNISNTKEFKIAYEIV